MPLSEQNPPSSNATGSGTRETGVAAIVSRTPYVLGLLFLLCAVPRVLMAGCLSEVCDDSYYYISVANALGEMDYDVAFAYLNLNVYPLILLGLHRLGLEWVFAGQLWGILVSSLTILPLFGWVRRLFDDRVAVASCFLYAVHGSLIELSAEPIRESTFWLAMTLCLYLGRRATSENRLALFALAGVSLSVALHTRTEAFLLFVPLGGWWLLESFRHPARRIQLGLGVVTATAAAIGLVVILNLVVLRGLDRWEFGKFHHFRVAWDWLQSGGSAVHPLIAAAQKDTSATPQVHALAQNVDAGVMYLLLKYLKDLARALEPLHLWMLLAGLIRWRRTLLDPDRAVLLAAIPVLLASIWIRLSYFGDTNGRYFLTVIFLCIPYMGLGLLWACEWTRNAVQRTRSEGHVAPALGLVLSAFVVVGWVDALIDTHPKREAQLRMGEWIRSRLGKPDEVEADYPATRLGYLAGGEVPELTWSDPFLQLTSQSELPDVVIFSVRSLTPEQFERVLSHADGLGFERIGESEFPRLAGEYCVLAPARQHDRFATAAAPAGSRTAGR